MAARAAISGIVAPQSSSLSALILVLARAFGPRSLLSCPLDQTPAPPFCRSLCDALLFSPTRRRSVSLPPLLQLVSLYCELNCSIVACWNTNRFLITRLARSEQLGIDSLIPFVCANCSSLSVKRWSIQSVY